MPCVVVFNGGSSSVRFAVYAADETLRRRLNGKIDRIGASDATFIVNDPSRTSQASRLLAAADYGTAVAALLDLLEAQLIFASVKRYITQHGEDMTEIRNWKRGREAVINRPGGGPEQPSLLRRSNMPIRLNEENGGKWLVVHSQQEADEGRL